MKTEDAECTYNVVMECALSSREYWIAFFPQVSQLAEITMFLRGIYLSIFCFSETWLMPSITQLSGHIPFLLVYRRNSPTKSDGDVGFPWSGWVARIHGECLVLEDCNTPQITKFHRVTHCWRGVSAPSLIGTHTLLGRSPPIYPRPFLYYSSMPIKYLVPLGKSGHATRHLHFTLSDLTDVKHRNLNGVITKLPFWGSYVLLIGLNASNNPGEWPVVTHQLTVLTN